MLDKHVLSFLPSSCDMKRRMSDFFAVSELHHEQWKVYLIVNIMNIT